MKDNSIVPCACQGSSFVDSHHNHVVSGDLRIVKNSKLRKLLTRGPKYREPTPLDWGKARDEIVDGVNKCVSNWCNKKGIDESVLQEWVSKVMQSVDTKIEHLNNRILPFTSQQVLKDPEVKKALSDLHRNFIIAPIDKATVNI